MDEGMVTAGVLLEAAQNQQKIAEASFAKLDALAKILRELPRDTTPELKASIEGAVRQELAGARQEIQLLTGSLRAARMDLGKTLLYYGSAVALVAVLAVATMLIWVFPSPAEMSRIRTEKATLEATVADLAARGGKIQFLQCGNADQKKRLCARVDTAAGQFGTKTETYMVLTGY